MRFGRFFIQEKKPAKGEIPGFFRRLEEVLDIEFPAPFLYPDLVPADHRWTGAFRQSRRWVLPGGGFGLNQDFKIPMRFTSLRKKRGRREPTGARCRLRPWRGWEGRRGNPPGRPYPAHSYASLARFERPAHCQQAALPGRQVHPDPDFLTAHLQGQAFRPVQQPLPHPGQFQGLALGQEVVIRRDSQRSGAGCRN